MIVHSMRLDAGRNAMLNRLASTTYEAVTSLGAIERFQSGQVFGADDGSAACMRFPLAGVLSVRSHTDIDPGVEVAMAGREGFVGHPLGLGPSFRVVAVVAGEALRLDPDRLPAEARRELAADPVVARYQQVVSVQIAQSALAAARRTVVERLARWILMCFDRVDDDILSITHEALSATLGVRRPGVTVATHELEGIGAIRARRGTIRLLDRAKLETVSRGCYGMPEREYRRLFAADGHRLILSVDATDGAARPVGRVPGMVLGAEAR